MKRERKGEIMRQYIMYNMLTCGREVDYFVAFIRENICVCV